MSAHTERKTDSAPLFKPFEWVSPEDQVNTGRYVLMSNVRDLASGVAVALEIIEKSNLNVHIGDAPVITGSEAARFTRMSIAAMNVIQGYIDEHFDEMSELGAVRRLAERGDSA